MLSKIFDMTSDATRRKARKILFYALIAIIIILSVIATANFLRGWVLQKKLEVLNGQMDQVLEANNTLVESVDSIRRLRDIDSVVLDTLAARLSTQLEEDVTLKNKIEILEATNESARDYLDTPIHPDVARLLEGDSEDRDGVSPSSEDADPNL